MVPALICSAFSAVLLQIANMDPHRGQPLHGGHFGGDPFDRYVHLRASETNLWHFLNRMLVHRDMFESKSNLILKYPKRTTGLSSLVSSSVMMWLCVFLISAQASAIKRRRNEKGTGPFNSMHTGLISLRAHYREERGFPLSRKMQVMRHWKYFTTLG